MDWRKSRLFLALRPHDVVAPPSLPQWIVDDMPQARAMPMMAGAPRQRAMAMKAADAVNEEISLNTEGQDARWEVSTPGLPQGESVVTLRDEIWTAALERVARPRRERRPRLADGKGRFACRFRLARWSGLLPAGRHPGRGTVLCCERRQGAALFWR